MVKKVKVKNRREVIASTISVRGNKKATGSQKMFFLSLQDYRKAAMTENVCNLFKKLVTRQKYFQASK